MKEFAFGTEEQYNWLENLISDGQCHVFNNCVLPSSCTPDHARLGFDKLESVYAVYIDHGVTTTAEDPNFARFLQDGETKFMSMEDMSEFFHSLQPLFNTDASASSVCTEKQKENSETEAVDIQSLVAERSQRDKPKLLSPDAISAPIKQKVFGQDEAIESLAELIVLNRMRKKSKLLTVMLLGPTATGKSETAKSLAEVLSDATGTKYGFIELAGNEFVGEHSVHRFFGAPPGYVGHGQPTALDAVRKNGYHCIVINEVEKADLKLIEGLMEAIDSGYLGMADNSKPIDLNHCILLLTSNLPINMEEYSAANDFQRSEMCRDAYTKHCGRPEISGKIGNFIAYQPLSVEAIAQIVVKFIRTEFDNYNLKLGTVSNSLMNYFLDCESTYGARVIALNVTTTVGKQLQRFLLRTGDPDALAGKVISLSGSIDNIQFCVN